MAKKKGIFIERDKLDEMIADCGGSLWDNFEANPVSLVNGNQYRCVFRVDGKKASLDFYYNSDGTTTLTVTGKHKDLSTVLETSIKEKYGASDTSVNKSYSFKEIPSEWPAKLIDYFKSREDITLDLEKENLQPKHVQYKFTSAKGDTITINVYANGTLMIQGKPIYLYYEALSILAYCPDINIADVNDLNNEFHGTTVTIQSIDQEMKSVLKNSYGKLDTDGIILKIFSPAFSNRHSEIPKTDYTCHVFSCT